MKVCTKCKIEKELDQYQKYWHSTQKKERVRGHCTECYYKLKKERRDLKRKEYKLIQVSIREEIIQPVQPELQPAILENNPNYRKCRTCQEYLHLDKYYHHNSKAKTPYKDCKSCISKEETRKARESRAQFLIENGGSDRHYEKPGLWMDDFQRDATYNILKAIGWNLNEENKIWWKDGVKTKDGDFINVKKIIKEPRRYFISEGFRHKAFEHSEDIYKLRLTGLSLHQIAYQYKTSAPTISKIIRLYEQTINE